MIVVISSTDVMQALETGNKELMKASETIIVKPGQAHLLSWKLPDANHNQ